MYELYRYQILFAVVLLYTFCRQEEDRSTFLFANLRQDYNVILIDPHACGASAMCATGLSVVSRKI